MKKSSIHLRLKTRRAELENANLSVAIDRATGRLADLTLKAPAFGRWNQVPGGLEIVDELTGARHRDDGPDIRVRVSRGGAGAPQALCVHKAFPGAAFDVVETWTPGEEDMEWAVTVKLKPGEAARSIQIRQFVPWPDQPYGWQVWTAQQHFPKLAAHLGNQRLVYGDICFGMALPIATVYHTAKGAGLSLAKPFGLKIPQWGFTFGTYHFGGIHAESQLLGLRPGHDAHVALLLRGHAGCWRPGLGWLVDKYPDYFQPGNPATPEQIEGGFMGGSPFSTDRDCRVALKAGAKVVEVHHIFPHYGNYFPEADSWKTIQWLEQPETAAAKRLPENSVARMRDRMAMFRRHGILPLPYIQVAGDGWRPWAERHFPESIARSRDGQYIPVWKNCWMMNSDPSLPFGRHIQRQIDRFFELYGDCAAGLFWDQPCYDAIDIDHDDGLTMVDNRPAYRLVFCYEQHAERMREEIRRRKMFLYANGPVYIELCRGVDAIMAEGVSWTADVVQYLCAARPMCFYSYFKPGETARMEEMYQKCLVLGGTCYSAHAQPRPRDMERLSDIYRPLIDRMRGRTFCFAPNPLTLPPGTEGNLFTGPGGMLFLPLLTRRSSALQAADNRGAPAIDIEIRVPQASRYARATLLDSVNPKERPIRLKHDGRTIVVTLRSPGVASLVCLYREAR